MQSPEIATADEACKAADGSNVRVRVRVKVGSILATRKFAFSNRYDAPLPSHR